MLFFKNYTPIFTHMLFLSQQDSKFILKRTILSPSSHQDQKKESKK